MQTVWVASGLADSSVVDSLGAVRTISTYNRRTEVYPIRVDWDFTLVRGHGRVGIGSLQ